MTKREALERVVAGLSGPTSVDELVQQVLALWPSKAKSPRTPIVQELRYSWAGRAIIFLDRDTVVPVWHILEGVCFRVPIERQEAKRGFLPAHFLSPFLAVALEEINFADERGQPLLAEITSLQVQVEGFFGRETLEVRGFDLATWFRARRVRRGDSVLVTILDHRAGRFALEHEPAKWRRQEEIERRNRELADLLYNFVLDYRWDQVPVSEAIITAYAHLSDPKGYPGDHWQEVVENDKRLRSLGHLITLATYRTPFEAMLFDEEITPAVSLSPEQELLALEREEKVYRLKAAFKYNKRIWREFEILGHQTLGDLDDLMRDGFGHDWSDHLSEFHVFPGGKRRKVGLGSIEPFGGGEGREHEVSHLGLEVGDKMEYVYDFGDWIEHILTLEAIAEPERGIQYPREVARNKPRYHYCRECKRAGKKTVAIWVCYNCSNAEGKAVYLCDGCVEEHENHYLEEIVY
jgi:hypothetical protein